MIVPVVGMIPMSVLMIVMVTPIRSPHTKEYAKDNLIPSVSHCIFYVVALFTLKGNRFNVFKNIEHGI